MTECMQLKLDVEFELVKKRKTVKGLNKWLKTAMLQGFKIINIKIVQNAKRRKIIRTLSRTIR